MAREVAMSKTETITWQIARQLDQEAYRNNMYGSENESKLLEECHKQHNKIIERFITTGQFPTDFSGLIWQESVADGYALYRVESTKPLTLVHLPHGDAYRVHPATIRGLTLNDLKLQIKQSAFWRTQISSRKKD